MGAVQSQKAELTELVAKQHQLFSENFYCLRNVVQVLSRPDYQPVFTKPCTGGSPRPNPRDIGQRNLLTLSLGGYFHHSAPLLIIWPEP